MDGSLGGGGGCRQAAGHDRTPTCNVQLHAPCNTTPRPSRFSLPSSTPKPTPLHLHSASSVASFCAAAAPLSRTISCVSSLGAAAAASAANLVHRWAGRKAKRHLQAATIGCSVEQACRPSPTQSSCCSTQASLPLPPDWVLQGQGHQLLHFLSHRCTKQHGLAAHGRHLHHLVDLQWW